MSEEDRYDELDYFILTAARFWVRTGLSRPPRGDATLAEISDYITELPPAAVADVREVLEQQPPELAVNTFLVRWSTCYVVVLHTTMSIQGFVYRGDASQPHATVTA